MSSFAEVREAARKVALLQGSKRTEMLGAFAQAIEANAAALISASKNDLEEHGQTLSAASRDRLFLDTAKVKQIVNSVRQVAALPDPLGAVQLKRTLDDGLELERIAVPLGVLGVIFESRADVAPQILSLALRSGNGVILKGGSETKRINTLYAEIMSSLSQKFTELPSSWFQMHHAREIVGQMLSAIGEIDLIIPRGSNSLVQSIIENSKIPVLGHADGVCHVYLEKSADLNQALEIIVDAKNQYAAACNALETLLVDAEIADSFLPLLSKKAREHGIELRGDKQQIAVDNWHIEYGEPILALKIVPDLAAAIKHINHYGSHHTDAILSQDKIKIERFLAEVDSANVYANCSTRFADGYRYGFGAEIGISTGRIHARGPVGIEGLLAYKYLLRGAGQIVATYSGENARKFKHS